MARVIWRYDDGGRLAAGYTGQARDCVARAAAIVTGLDYREVYDLVNEAAKRERPRQGNGRSSAREGVYGPTTRRVMADLGLVWTPTMGIGTGTTVHLKADELPAGRLVVQVSRHVVAVIEGVIHDIFDPTRDGTRCVYGYWREP